MRILALAEDVVAPKVVSETTSAQLQETVRAAVAAFEERTFQWVKTREAEWKEQLQLLEEKLQELSRLQKAPTPAPVVSPSVVNGSWDQSWQSRLSALRTLQIESALTPAVRAKEPTVEVEEAFVPAPLTVEERRADGEALPLVSESLMRDDIVMPGVWKRLWRYLNKPAVEIPLPLRR